MEGRILGNRYQIIEKVGGGGMAYVYKAKDMLLNRYVAVKMLRSEYTDDHEIVERFKAEAQSAARLAHHNIVSIYDVGEENGVHYIVMEYIDGITIRQCLERNGPIPFEDVINIGIQIASALEHAHKNKIIHRDIKSQNIMVTPDGVIKVTDFGIARAANTASTLTNLGNAIGSVHYFSPEQAKGGYVDERSDIYSLGITMYEMSTGIVPFDADSPISVALQHLNEPAKPANALRPEIPVGLNDIIMKAIRKDPHHRYQSATEMSADLVFASQHPNMPISDGENEVGKTRKYDRINTPVKKKEKGGEEKEIKNKWKWIIGAVVIGIALMILAAFLVSYIIGGPKKNPEPEATATAEVSSVAEYTLEDYNTLNVDEVINKLSTEAPWLKVEQVLKTDPTAEKGVVLAQDPASGQVIKSGDSNVLKLTVSAGKEMVVIPGYTNVKSSSYKADLINKGLNPIITQQFSTTVAKDMIISVNPAAGTEVDAGSNVQVVVSKGPQDTKIAMPNLVGLTLKQAKAAIKSNQLVLGTVLPEGGNDSYIVKTQSPKFGTMVNKNTVVNLTLDIYVYKSYRITIDVSQYSFPVTFRVDALASDANTPITMYVSENCKAADFPKLISNIKVPIGGSTQLKVYVDGVLDNIYTVK